MAEKLHVDHSVATNLACDALSPIRAVEARESRVPFALLRTLAAVNSRPTHAAVHKVDSVASAAVSNGSSRGPQSVSVSTHTTNGLQRCLRTFRMRTGVWLLLLSGLVLYNVWFHMDSMMMSTLQSPVDGRAATADGGTATAVPRSIFHRWLTGSKSDTSVLQASRSAFAWRAPNRDRPDVSSEAPRTAADSTEESVDTNAGQLVPVDETGPFAVNAPRVPDARQLIAALPSFDWEAANPPWWGKGDSATMFSAVLTRNASRVVVASNSCSGWGTLYLSLVHPQSPEAVAANTAASKGDEPKPIHRTYTVNSWNGGSSHGCARYASVPDALQQAIHATFPSPWKQSPTVYAWFGTRIQAARPLTVVAEHRRYNLTCVVLARRFKGILDCVHVLSHSITTRNSRLLWLYVCCSCHFFNGNANARPGSSRHRT